MYLTDNVTTAFQLVISKSFLNLQATKKFGKFCKALRCPGSWKGNQDIVPRYFALRSLLFLGLKTADYGQLSEKALTLVKG